jgi:hypothetical protein
MLADLALADRNLEATCCAHLRRERALVVVRFAAFRTILLAATTVR